MKIGWKIAIVVLVVIILIVLYKYIFAPENKVVVVNTPRPVSTTQPVLEVDNCAPLTDMKLVIEGLWKTLDTANTNVITGTMPGRGGPITDPVQIKNAFDSANYNYQTKIIEYNGIIDANKCAVSKIIPRTDFTPVTSGGSGPVLKTNNSLDCNSQQYKDKLMMLAVEFKNSEIAYQLAYINNKNYDVAETRSKLEQATNKYTAASVAFTDYNNLCNKK